MCDTPERCVESSFGRTVPVAEAVGTILAHDITEIVPGQQKGRAFRKGHIIRQEDVPHLRRLGKENLFILDMKEDEMHEDEAAREIAKALMGSGVESEGDPKEGKINIVASHDGLLKVDREALLAFNMVGEVMCATLHDNSLVRKGQLIAGTRAIPLVIKKQVVKEAVEAVRTSGSRVPGCGVLEVKEIRKPRVGVVITGSEVYLGRIEDAFAPVIRRKIENLGGEIAGLYYAPDDTAHIEMRLRELLLAGADLLITTGGMSVDPDDVTRFAIRNLGAQDITYGSAVLPGAMFLTAYIEQKPEAGKPEPAGARKFVPIVGIPACGMYHSMTVFDLVLPRILAGERIGRRELAELGHGGLCLNCKECRYPVCPFGK